MDSIQGTIRTEHGFRRKKHTAEISYETLMEIKDKLDSFEGSIFEEMEYCLELLTEEGAFTEAQWKPKWQRNQPNFPFLNDNSVNSDEKTDDVDIFF